MWPFSKPTPPAQPEETRTLPVMSRPQAPQPRSRAYAAAGNQARYSDFKTSIASADAELQVALGTLRGKARALDRNSSAMRRFLQLLEVNVVGANGFMYKCRVKKIDGSMDVSLNSRVEMAWWKWCQCVTTDGKMTMIDFLVQMVSTWGRDGEYIFEIVLNQKYPDGIAVNPLESDMLDETLNVSVMANGNSIKMGVEIAEDGAVVAYHFLQVHPGEPSWNTRTTRNRWRRVTADRIVHVYKVRRPGQTRGEPPTSTVVNPIKMLDGYREAEVTGRRLNAAQGGYIETEAGAASNIDALADGGRETEDPASDLIMNVEPGVVRGLAAGQKFVPFNPNGVVSDYQQFEGQIKKDIASGVGISAMSHGMQTEGISYSGGRTVTIEDRDFYKSLQTFFISGGMERLHAIWLQSHSLQDTASFPPSRMSAIMDSHTFRGRGWDWVDPSKDIKANSEGLRTRQMSLSQVAGRQGIDIEDLVDEIAQDEEMLRSRGLTITTDPPKVAKDAAGPKPAKT